MCLAHDIKHPSPRNHLRSRSRRGVDSTQGAPGGASEACSLLDDYALCDLAESPPAFGWESPDAQGRTAADRKNDRRQAELQGESREEALRREKPATAPLLGGFYDALVAAVVRPPRFEYDPRLLGPSSFAFGGRRYHRHDVVIENERVYGCTARTGGV